MSNFTNNPNMNKGGESSIKRFVHQPLTVNHGGFKFSIQANGKTVISGPSKPDKDNPGEYIFDEIEVPASLIFKISQALQMTREVKFLTMSEVKANPSLSSAPEEV